MLSSLQSNDKFSAGNLQLRGTCGLPFDGGNFLMRCDYVWISNKEELYMRDERAVADNNE